MEARPSSQPASHARSTIRRSRSPAASQTVRSWPASSGGRAAASTVRDSAADRIGTKSSSHESSSSPNSLHRLEADHLRQLFVRDGRQLEFPQLHAAPAHRHEHLGPRRQAAIRQARGDRAADLFGADAGRPDAAAGSGIASARSITVRRPCFAATTTRASVPSHSKANKEDI